MGSVGRAFAQAPATDQTLRLAFTNPTVAFDTGREGGTPELHLLMFDGLTFYNWETHVTEPVIATSWDYDPATLTYVFHLRDDVTWTTGAPGHRRRLRVDLEAQPQSRARLAERLVSRLHQKRRRLQQRQSRRGRCRRYRPGRPDLAGGDGGPHALFPDGHLAVAILPAAARGHRGASATTSGWSRRTSSPSDRSSLSAGITTSRWCSVATPTTGASAPRWSTSSIACTRTPRQQSLASYEADELDLAAVPPAEADRVLADSRLSQEVVHWAESRNWQLRIDHRNPDTVLKNVNVRKALYLAIDRDLIVKQLLKGQGIASLNFVPPDIPGNNPAAALPGGPAEAKQFLETAGYPGGKGFPGFKLGYVPTQAEAVLVSQALVSMWKDVLNISVDLLPGPDGLAHAHPHRAV